uniref:RING-type E3 ubiquitin transferase n=3 Tax=Aegilops tauschii subsp. strangulata TaxID=200361 RepID=A0A453ER66_AEGTS
PNPRIRAAPLTGERSTAMGELVVARRYWCHMCAAAVSPVAADAGVEIKCPYCGSGFLEEMETARSSVATGTGHAHASPSADNAISIWAPIIDS